MPDLDNESSTEHAEHAEHVSTVVGTASAASSTHRSNISETVADHEPYHTPYHTGSPTLPLHDVLEEGVSSELHRIATAISRRRSHATAGAPEPLETDPVLNPESASFDVTKWVKTFVSELNDQGHKPSGLGVVFTDLDVFGSGSALQLQETVKSVLLAPLRAGELFAAKKDHKQILHGFNGLLKSGELLAVLGRPGSGCSTFLKSVCGELHGLTLGKGTDIHYNGASQPQMKKEFKGEVIYNQEVCAPCLNVPVGQYANQKNRSTSTLPTSQSGKPSSSPPPCVRPRSASTACPGPSTASTLPAWSWPSLASLTPTTPALATTSSAACLVASASGSVSPR